MLPRDGRFSGANGGTVIRPSIRYAFDMTRDDDGDERGKATRYHSMIDIDIIRDCRQQTLVTSDLTRS